MDIKPSSRGQSLDGIMIQMSDEYKIICKSGKDLLGEANLFCSILSRWIELDWWRKWYNADKEQWYEYDSFKCFIETGGREGLGLWLEREGKDLQLLVKAGIEGAELIWCMWLEQEFEEGRGLQEHGECDSKPRTDSGTFETSRGDNVTSGQRGNSNEYTMSRFIRDIHSEETPPERKQQLLPLLEDVKAGRKSVHRAAVAAGYRKEKTPYQQAVYWISKCSAEEKEDIAAHLQSEQFSY